MSVTPAASQTRVLVGTGITLSGPGSAAPAPQDHSCRGRPRLRDDLYGQKARLLCWGRNRGGVRRITGIAQPLEDQVRVHRVAPRHLSHRNARRRRLETDRTLLLIRPKSLRPTRHAITIVSTIDGGHYPALCARGRAVRPDAYDQRGFAEMVPDLISPTPDGRALRYRIAKDLKQAAPRPNSFRREGPQRFVCGVQPVFWPDVLKKGCGQGPARDQILLAEGKFRTLLPALGCQYP